MFGEKSIRFGLSPSSVVRYQIEVGSNLLQFSIDPLKSLNLIFMLHCWIGECNRHHLLRLRKGGEGRGDLLGPVQCSSFRHFPLYRSELGTKGWKSYNRQIPVATGSLSPSIRDVFHTLKRISNLYPEKHPETTISWLLVARIKDQT